MTKDRAQRKLAAIVAADVVGWSRLMGRDEEGTLDALKRHREELIDPKVAAFGGRLVGTAGDSMLFEFPSALGAVQCAAEVQGEMRRRNAGVAEDDRIELRVGINLGDVIVDGDDIHGDGVNVAARLEAMAEPGGISISAKVFEEARNRLDLDFEDLGEQTFKNISHPVRTYRIALDPAGVGTGAAARPGAPGAGPTAKPSIAVLAFENMSGDPEQEYFSDGITEDVITALSRVRWFFVIARNSTFAFKGRAVDVKQVARDLGVHYVLEGSVRKAGNRLRLNAQLIDGATGNHLWARRYDRELEDIFAVQDELTETIVGAIEPELGKAERERAKSKRPESLDAWESHQRGLSHLYRYTKEDLDSAQALFEQAIVQDSGLAPAHSGLAEVYYYRYVYGFADSPSECRERALGPARRAVELDREDASAHCTLGRVHYLRREHAAAIPELKTALELNPSLALAHYGLGAAMVFSGRARDAVEHLEAAIRLSPHDPNMGSFLVRLADAHLFVRRYDEAVVWAEKALRELSFQWSRDAVLISALGHLGRREEARRVLDELLTRRPDFTRAFVRETHLFDDPGDFEHFIAGLEKAGVPA